MRIRFNKIRSFKRRFGVLSPRVVVRAEIPRKIFFLFFVALVLIGGSIFWFYCASDGGESKQLLIMRDKIFSQQVELDLLRSTAGTGKNEIGIERAAQQQLLRRLHELEVENTALKEDMLIFEHLIPVVSQGPLVKIENFRVIFETSARYRYRFLLAYQASQRTDSFRGLYQLVVRFEHAGALQLKKYPDSGGAALEIRHFLRREGVIEIPVDAKLTSVELRVLQDGKLVSKQDVHF